MGWFDVDRAGLAAILERRGKFFAVAELVSNAWDSGATMVDILLETMAGEPYCKIKIEDNGEGFASLTDAHTLFARSRRAGDLKKRGRFSLGEKLVLACCRRAEIVTTSGSLIFKADGSKVRSQQGRQTGTLFEAELRMTRDEFATIHDEMKRLIPPVRTVYNGWLMDRPDSAFTFRARLPVEIADEDGRLRRSTAMVDCEAFKDESGSGEILEMGIPVVTTENGYRVNVDAKIPLNMERDNVTPGFLRALQAALLNAGHDDLDAEAAAKPWVQEAAGDARAHPDAVKSVIIKRFGDRAVIATPNDPIANANAAASGYTVIAGGALSGDLWSNVKKAGVLLPASQVFPTPRPAELAAKHSSSGEVCPSCGRPF